MDELDVPTDGRIEADAVRTLEDVQHFIGELSIRSGQEVYYRGNDPETERPPAHRSEGVDLSRGKQATHLTACLVLTSS